jgi:hypothetical protein
MEKTDLRDIYGVFHSTAIDYTFFSAAHGPFSKIYHILSQKVNLNTYKKFKIITWILTKHNVINLEINAKENNKKTFKVKEIEQHTFE